MESEENSKSRTMIKHMDEYKIKALFLPLIAFFYILTLDMGFKSYINFIPSPDWTLISLVLSVTFGLPYAALASPWYRPELSYKILGMATAILVCGVLFYKVLAYGMGPAITAYSYTTIEKDIDGTIGKDSYYNYYVYTTDLSGIFYITENEFKSIHHSDARMHVTLKKSFFGIAVEHYAFLPNNAKLNQPLKH